MGRIRRAKAEDAWRIAEMTVMNYRLNFYPFFHNDAYFFGSLNVPGEAAVYAEGTDALRQSYVYDDGVVKGFCRVNGGELEKLYVEPAFQSAGIGGALLQYAVTELGAEHLWALKYNARGIAFYERNGFVRTGEEMLWDGWVPLIQMSLNR